MVRSPGDDIKNVLLNKGTLGSYAGAGYLVSKINATGTVSGYSRFLDLDQGIARTTWTQGGTSFIR